MNARSFFIDAKETDLMPKARKYFEDYRHDAHNWITLTSGEYYPDILPEACELYKPVLVLFGQIMKRSETSERLFMNVCEIPDGWMRIQLTRVFKKYVSPDTPVELLKKKTQAKQICEHFGNRFRPINEVQAAFESRPIPDEALCAVLWEYKDRGKKGYDLTEKFFGLLRAQLPRMTITGPERVGKDILLGSVFNDYPNPQRPVDFIISDKKGNILAVGLARYDSDRGGAQEDDRTGGYKNCADEMLNYFRKNNLNTKVIFLNDGPGLLLGSMWSDYSDIEKRWKDKIMVLTLRMVSERLTKKWLENKE
jgi:hypothetical protein